MIQLKACIFKFSNQTPQGKWEKKALTWGATVSLESLRNRGDDEKYLQHCAAINLMTWMKWTNLLREVIKKKTAKTHKEKVPGCCWCCLCCWCPCLKWVYCPGWSLICETPGSTSWVVRFTGVCRCACLAMTLMIVPSLHTLPLRYWRW